MATEWACGSGPLRKLSARIPTSAASIRPLRRKAARARRLSSCAIRIACADQRYSVFMRRWLIGTFFLTLAATTYEDSMRAWQQHRDAGLRAADGWLALVGLFWLKP